MRPDILNPLFAEVAALKGVGPALARPLERLKLTRVVDVAFHLPTGAIERVARTELDMADAGRTVTISVTPRDIKSSSSPRGPTRVNAFDALGNHVSLTYFGGGSGWVRKLYTLGVAVRVSGKLEMYGQELQMVHPDIEGEEA